MFNVERAISEWRLQMVAGGLTSADALDELEAHLRDDVEAQVRSGSDEQRAFDLACQRLGTPAALGKEFGRSDHREVVSRRPALRSFYFLCATAAILVDAWTLASFELSLGERVGAGLGVAVLAVYLFGLPLQQWWWSGGGYGLVVKLVKAGGLIVPLWTVFALLTALRIITLDIGIVPEMVMWSLCAAYGLTVLAGLLSVGGNGGLSGGPLEPNPAPWPFPPNRPFYRNFIIPLPPPAAFTPAARHTLRLAHEEAMNLGHDFVGTEHVLLALLKTAGEALNPVLQQNRVTPGALEAEIHRLVLASPIHPTQATLPWTPRARKALQLAARKAAALEPSPIGARHLLLGLLLEGSGVAAVALRNLGVRLDGLLKTEPA